MTRSSFTYTTSAAPGITQYKAIAGGISTQLNTVLTRTNDSGQVNFSTVSTVPGATRDYEVFALTDALQTTFPVVFRVDYDVSSPSIPIAFTIGTGTNGAGTIAGTMLTKTLGYVVAAYTPTGGLTRYAYASSDGSYLMLAVNVQASTANVPDAMGCIVIERTRDADGTPNGNGLTIWRWSAGADSLTAGTTSYTGCYSRLYDSTGTIAQPALTFELQCVLPNPANNTTYALNNASYAFPCLTAAGFQLQGASKVVMAGIPTDFTRGSTVAISHYGASMQFLPMGTGQPMQQPYMSSATAAATRTVAPLLRFE